ncbi:MAG TPA: hypothetical protein VJS44_04615 [Pyrinomonadaceae bacterium]|nr:hypothetical protein [Pyrinomonadaceae bacterium]
MAADELSLLLRMKGESSQLKSEVSGARAHVTKETTAIAQAGSGLFKNLAGDIEGATSRIPVFGSALSGLAGPIGVVVGASTALATAYVGIGVGLFNLTRATAEYDGQLKDLNQQTGISVETLSTLKLAADNSGSSIDGVNGSLSRYLKSISDAVHGNEELRKQFERVGFTSADLQRAYSSSDEAVSLLVQKISQLGNEEDRLNALQLIGVRNGKDLNGVINEMNGSLEDFRETAEEMGLIVTPEQAEQADKFSASLHIVDLQLKSIGYTFGREVMPEFQRGIDGMSGGLKDNQNLWDVWAKLAASGIRLVVNEMAGLTQLLKVTPLGVLAGLMGSNADVRLGSMGGAGIENMLGSLIPRDLGDREKKGGADKARQEQLRLLDDAIKKEEGLYKKETEFLKREYDLQLNSLQSYTASAIEEERTHYQELERAINQKIALAKKDSEREKFRLELQKAQDERDKAIQRLRDEQQKKELESLREHQDALLRLSETYDERRKASIRALAEFRLITEERMESAIARIEEEAFNRQLEILSAQERAIYERAGFRFDALGNMIEGFGDLSKVNLEAVRKMNDAIAQLTAEQEARQEEAERKIEAARQRDFDNEIKRLDDLYRAQRRYADGWEELERERYEWSIRYGGLSIKTRAWVIANIARLDVDAIYAEAERNKKALEDDEAKLIEAARREIQDEEEKQARIKAIQDQYRALKELEDEKARERDRQRQRQAEQDIFNAQHPGLGGFLDSSGLSQLGDQAAQVGVMGAALQNLGDIAGNVFASMGQGLGQMVGQWTLLGNQADISIRKMTASVLAGLATQATTMAFFFAAMGVVSLTPWGAALFGPAAPWFQGALLMGAVALTAAALGRVVAGNSFQNKSSSRALGGGGVSAGGGAGEGSGGRRTTTGGFYSGQDDKTIEQGRNQLPPQHIYLHLESNDSHILRVIQDDVSNNGPTRNLIIETSSAA